jgi:two-component system LytT family response regulator
MPELTGFDVLERLDYIPLVIFSTAYDQYALRAFEVYSVDYLLKPVDPARLKLAVDKLQRLSAGEAGDLRERVQQALETFKDPRKIRIQVRIGDRIRLISATDVVFFVASDKYVEVHTRNETHLITKSLSKLESELPADDFVRVHRSVIVNINFVDEISKSFGGAYEVRMKDAEKTRLPVSRRYKSRLDLG